MNRAPYLSSFKEGDVPAWRCPTCKEGRLRLAPDSLSFSEGESSKALRGHPHWEPDWIEYRFTCMFVCEEAQCGEAVACLGTGSGYQVWYYDQHGGGDHEEVGEIFTPKVFLPPLHLMDIPKGCPNTVSEYLRKSFALFFADPAAAMNTGRGAVELLLTDLRVPRYTTVKRKRKPLNLSARIDKLREPYKAQLKDLLDAVRWLGNTGSHPGDEPTHPNVVTMYDLLEHILEEVYEPRADKMKALAKGINRRKGL